MSVKAGLPPVVRSGVRLLLLGSLPGDASLAAARYYAHPTNQFWRLLGGAIGEVLQELDYEMRLARLADRHVGLWDVIASANRKGSLDQAIREAQLNRIEQLLDDFPTIRAIGFNGGVAASEGRKLLGRLSEKIRLIDLPSSSAANTRSLEEKAAEWAVLGQFVEP